MLIAAIISLCLAAILAGYAVFTFVDATQPGPMDQMGRGILFSQLWVGAAVFCSLGIAVYPEAAWWWGIVVFVCLYPVSFVIQHFLGKLLYVINWRGIRDS